MASGSFEFAASGYLQGKIDWSSSSNGSEANSSVVTATVYARRTNGYETYGQSWSGYVKIGNAQTNISFSNSISVAGNWVAMATVSTTVGHNAEGVGSVAISGSVTGPAGTSLSGNTSSGSQTVTLDNIPRASSFTISGNTLGSAVNVTITRASTSFTHTVTLKFGTVSESKTSVATSTSFTPNLSTYGAMIPNNVSGTGNITVDTYSGSTLIGSKTLPITLNMPSTAVPTISSVTLAEAVSGLASKFGAYIQSKSKIKVTTTASGVYGSTITSYKVEINGSTYNTATCTTGVLNTSGSNTCKVTVTDSRGRTSAVTTKTFTVLAYAAPKITKFTAQRNSSTNTTIDCVMSASISSLNSKNDKSFIVTTSVSSGNKYSKTDAYSISNATCAITGASATASYTVTLTVKDYFSTVTQTINIGTAFALMNFSADGEHIGIGQVYDTADDSRVQIGGNLKVNGDIKVTGDAQANAKVVSRCGSNTAGTSGWYKVCSQTMSGHSNVNLLYYIKAGYTKEYYGLFELEIRSNNTSITCWLCQWALRSGFSTDNVRIVISGMTWTLYVFNPSGQYGAVYFSEIQHRGIGGAKNSYGITYYNSTAPETTEPVASFTTTDIKTYQLSPKNLYNNTTGTTGTVTLSETAANFKYLEVFSVNPDGTDHALQVNRIYSPNGKKFNINTIQNGTDLMYITAKYYSISGTSITVSKASQVGTIYHNAAPLVATYETTKIVRVDGYR